MSSLTHSSFLDAETLMSIRHLEFRARVVVEGFWSGFHRSPYHGFSVEFTEYRQYTPGDDLRYLDWRLFARTDRHYLKKFEDETNLRCFLLVDNSNSLSFGTGAWKKIDYAKTLAATLAWFLYSQGDALGLLSFDQEIREYLPARHRTGHLRQLMTLLERPTTGRNTDLSAPLRRIAELIRKRSLMILISDLLAPVDDLEHDLAALVASGHEVIVFQILDPAEKTLDFTKPIVFRDLESQKELYIDPATARAQYQQRFQEHYSAVEGICHRLGAGFRSFTTDQPLELALYDFLRERLKRSRTLKTLSHSVNKG